MTALAQQTTIPAYPLGRPVDGRERYSMTREQAYVYRWLVKCRPHHLPFTMNFREVAQTMASTHGNIHARVAALVERGWLERVGNHYRLVAPVMQFREARA